MGNLCYLCLLFVMLSRLFIAVLWSPAGKGLTSRRLFVKYNCIFVTFPCGILGQMWYFIVSIPDLCRLPYFNVRPNMCVNSSMISTASGYKSCLYTDTLSAICSM